MGSAALIIRYTAGRSNGTKGARAFNNVGGLSLSRLKLDGMVFRRDKVQELRQQGQSIRSIAKELGCSTGTVTNVLRGRFMPAA